MKVAFVAYWLPDQEVIRRAATGESPRLDGFALVERLQAEIVESGLPQGRMTVRSRLRRVPALWTRLGLRRGEFDAVYCPCEVLGAVAATSLYGLGWQGRLIFAAHRMTQAKMLALKPIFNRTDSIAMCVSRRQAEIMVAAGFSSDRIHHAYNWIDTQFFTPEAVEEEDYVFACGLENRDYETLIAAFAKLPYRLVLAASGFHGADSSISAGLPDNVHLLPRKVAWAELRTLYAKARFVVLPLNPVDYAAGVTGLVEAMAMGKAVVATSSPGIAEYLEDGESGRVVRPHDVEALTNAVEHLWRNPQLCRRIGQRNRTWVQRASLDNYTEQIRALVVDRPQPSAHGVLSR